MYLFSRRRRLDPSHGRAGVAYAIEAGAAALMADPDWLTMLDERAGTAYEADATRTMHRRLV